jgi:hypothetical protein
VTQIDGKSLVFEHAFDDINAGITESSEPVA